MATDHRAELARIQRFDQLVRYLRDQMGWPIASDDFEELTFDYTAEELGINISRECDAHLRQLVRAEQERRWREQHAGFVAAYNRTVAEQALPLDEWRSF